MYKFGKFMVMPLMATCLTSMAQAQKSVELEAGETYALAETSSDSAPSTRTELKRLLTHLKQQVVDDPHIDRTERQAEFLLALEDRFSPLTEGRNVYGKAFYMLRFKQGCFAVYNAFGGFDAIVHTCDDNEGLMSK